MKNRTVVFFGKALPYPIIFLSVVLLVEVLINSCTRDDDYIRNKDEQVTELIMKVRSDSLFSYVKWLQEMGTRFALADNRKEVAEKIRSRFIGFGYLDTRIDSFIVSRVWKEVEYNMWQYNVIATLRGSRYPDSICVVGAHYDDVLRSGDSFTTGRGANDNASGVAATMEIARVLKEESFNPECTVEFVAFAAEEIGLFGSLDYAHKADSLGWKVKMMLNNDMIAYESDTQPGNWIVNIMHYENSVNLRNKAAELCYRYTLLSSVTNNESNTRSDSYPFALYGFKALFFHAYDGDPNYHTINDIYENCNFLYCSEVTKVSLALIVRFN